MEQKDKILIVGMGITGRNVLVELGGLNPDTYDRKQMNLPARKQNKYNFIFICVDTPYIDSYTPCDIGAIESVIETWSDNLEEGGIFVLKSTVLPRTTEMLVAKYNEFIVYSPEYYGNTQHCNNFNFNFTILGGREDWCIEVQQLLQKVHDARHSFRIVDSTTAEIVKYMENSWLATQVSFCSQFFDICQNNRVSYEKVRELFILDPRVSPSHTFIDRDKPYWDSHCLNKDVRAIAETENAAFLNNVIKFNEKRKLNNKTK